jgi:hypothetical protein
LAGSQLTFDAAAKISRDLVVKKGSGEQMKHAILNPNQAAQASSNVPG